MMPLQNVGRGAQRIVKNYIKGYSDTQTKVRAATSNDAWGPSGTEMNELAQMTYNQQDFVEIMEMLDQRLNDKGKNWRHVFKSLTLLDYILHAGSENVVLYFQENIYIVKTLREFVYVDEEGKDQGANVRQKAKEITNLLMDDARMREQRRTRSNMRDRMSGRKPRDEDDDSDDDDRRRNRNNRRETRTNEDDELARAMEESRKSAKKDQDRARSKAKDDADMEEAMRLSREEEERRKRALAGNNGSLFDEEERRKQAAANNNSLGWDSLIDTNDPPPQQQPMMTGFASYNPYAQQQAQQQAEYLRMQQEMEMQRQMQAQAEQEQYNQMMAQQAYLQQQQQYQQMLAQQQQQQQPLIPQHTSIGSNNPFAAFAQSQSKPPSPPPPMPAMPEVARPASTPAAPALAPRPPKDDGKHAQLAALLGAREDGIDTFGNYGNLRYGQAAGRLNAQATGNNPFMKNQQQQQKPKPAEQPFFEL